MEVNPERRKFLKFLLIGGGAFLIGLLTRFLGPASKIFKKPGAEEPQEKDFSNWRVVEQKEKLIFIDKKANEEVMILDWGDDEDKY